MRNISVMIFFFFFFLVRGNAYYFLYQTYVFWNVEHCILWSVLLEFLLNCCFPRKQNLSYLHCTSTVLMFKDIFLHTYVRMTLFVNFKQCRICWDIFGVEKQFWSNSLPAWCCLWQQQQKFYNAKVYRLHSFTYMFFVATSLFFFKDIQRGMGVLVFLYKLWRISAVIHYPWRISTQLYIINKTTTKKDLWSYITEPVVSNQAWSISSICLQH